MKTPTRISDLIKRIRQSTEYINRLNINKPGAKPTPRAATPKKPITIKEKGLNINQLLNAIQPKIRSNAIRDHVTIVTLKTTKDKMKILSKTLTYDNEGARQVIRPHKHVVTKFLSEGETPDTKFSAVKRVKLSCDCAYWLYHCEWSLAKKWGAADLHYSIDEPPVEKNPQLNPWICKHLYCVLRFIKINRL
jgi:predicted Holliday junction resolvase-like endonuclease